MRLDLLTAQCAKRATIADDVSCAVAGAGQSIVDKTFSLIVAGQSSILACRISLRCSSNILRLRFCFRPQHHTD
jgi:hypothetical protein